MKLKGGYHKRILDIDLKKGKSKSVDTKNAYALKYIGGRGYGARMLWDSLGSIRSPLDESNILVMASGPLTGLYIPSSGKMTFASISPATGIYADSNVGGSFGVELRQTGYDAVVIRGRAREPSYIWIDDDSVQIKSAKKYVGCVSSKVEHDMKKDLGDEKIKVAATGPAGEKLVNFACITTDWGRNAGRTGMGAIMGSKNLKAIALRGSVDLPVHDLDGMIEAGRRAFEYLRGHDLFRFWQQQGLMSVLDYVNNAGVLPTYNFRDGVFDRADSINGETMLLNYKIGDSACFSCPMACGNVCLVKEGKYAGAVIDGPEYETACMFGSNVGVDKFDAIIRANQLCDDMGIDTISTGNIIAVLIDAYEQGIIKKDDIDGMTPRWGDDEAVMKLIEKIAMRDGVGDILAGGSKVILEKWPNLKPLVSQVKGLEQSAYDARAAITMALEYATADVGAHHNRAWPIAKELEMGLDWPLEKKADLVIYHQTVRPLFDMLSVCRLPWIELGLNEEAYVGMYEAVTGTKTTLKELLERSEAVYNITRMINVKLGIRRADDMPPDPVFDRPIRTGPHAGAAVDREKFRKLLDIYYRKRGWDVETGIPLQKTLNRLGLEGIDVKNELG